jgi:hypothetical protein
MENVTERSTAQRFTLSLPLTVRANGPAGVVEYRGYTKDVSFRGLYFLAETEFEAGTQIDFVLTLPKEITKAMDVNIRCSGQVVRVEPHDVSRGIAARIDRYEFLPASA